MRPGHLKNDKAAPLCALGERGGKSGATIRALLRGGRSWAKVTGDVDNQRTGAGDTTGQVYDDGMSIWATQWSAEIPCRTEYGERLADGPLSHLYVCWSGMSSELRLSVDVDGRGVVAYLSPDEARHLAAAILRTADATEAANKADAAV